ncbi:MAG: signal peptidase I [Nitrosopumilus sp.]|nr:signal peptidase I [Nitrosopumilus sp.]MDC4229312.1 signal peptidase I [Nitrosopumilus sp.]MDC4229635.1 signal peptidase I [Nitrosopumilus sp.]
MAKRSNSKGIIKDIAIVGVAVVIMWIGIQVVFGTEMLTLEGNQIKVGGPFYVVVSGSMIPVLQVYDIIVIQGHDTFEEVEIGDIIVFDRPSDHNRVIVHRVVSITNEDPKTIRTQGDANPGSIPGTDFPITEEEYIGKVAYIIPQLGYVTQILQPPTNYIIIAVVIGIMIIKQFTGKKKDADDIVSKETLEELSDIGKIEADSEYSEDVKKSEITEEKIKDSEKSTKKDSSDKENNQ